MVSIKICNGTSCYLKGAYNVLQYFQHEIEARGLHDRINLTGSFCLGNCEHGVSLEIDGKIYERKEKGSSVLYDLIDGEWVIHEMSDYEPQITGKNQ